MAGQTAEITWRDGRLPVSVKFDDPYYSIDDGLAESRFVFLKGNDLPARFQPGFHIGELGFGTGLNMLAAWKAWRDAGIDGPLSFTSFEAYPMARNDMARALQTFPEMSDLADPLLAAWPPGDKQIELPGLVLNVIIGDARQTLANWKNRADAWFLDGFAPARNPELWEQGLLNDVARHTAPAGTFSTYTAAGAVRRALNASGFQVERIAGFAGKRHMTIGRLDKVK